MALHLFQQAGLNDSDSDETHFTPDPHKEPEEWQRSQPDDEDAYFERTYNRYLSSADGWNRESHEVPLPESDETFYEPAETAQVVPDPEADSLDSPRASRADSDETFYEPLGAAADQADFGSDSGLASSRAHSAEQRASALLMASTSGDKNESYTIEDVMRAVQEHPEELHHSQPESSDLPRSAAPTGASDQGLHCGHDDGEATADALYIQMRDPLTQEIRMYLVPGWQSQADPDSLQLMTQDLEWTQTQQFGAAPNACLSSPPRADAAAAEAGQPPIPSKVEGFDQDIRLETQDLCWTQTQLIGAGGVDTSDLPLPRSSSAEMDVGSASAAVLERRSSSSFMEVAAPADTASVVPTVPGVPRLPPPGAVYSSESSEPLKTSPSFDDDYLLPLSGMSGLPWPLLGEQGCNIAEIVASLSNMSFSLDHVEDREHAVEAGRHPGQPGPPGPPATPRPSCSPAPTARAAAPRSPTFTIMHRRRGRRPRGRNDRGPGPQPEGAVGPGGPAGGPAASGGTSTKRKRSGRPAGPPEQQPLPRPSGSQSQGFSCSPSSPPPQKARRSQGSQGGPIAPIKERQEMIASYSRLLELRFLMQDIVAGRESFPAAVEILKMREEVLVIMDNMRQFNLIDGKLTGKAKQRREEARQVADKILHQLRVLAEESQGSCAGTECSTEPLVQSTSWSAPTTNDYKVSTQKCFMNTSQLVCSENPQKIRNHGQKKRTRERKCRKKQSSVEFHENLPQQGTSRKSSQSDFTFGEGHSNVEQKEVGNYNTNLAMTCQSITPLVVDENLHQGYLQLDSVSSLDKKNCEGISPVMSVHNQGECGENILHPSDKCENLSDPIMINAPASLSQDYAHDYPSENDSCSVKQPDMSCQEAELQMATGPLFEETDPKAVKEYKEIVSKIRESATARIAGKQAEVYDSVWRGGPLKFTAVLLPKRSELHPIDDLPPNFWEDPNAPIPEEWISLLDWDD